VQASQAAKEGGKQLWPAIEFRTARWFPPARTTTVHRREQRFRRVSASGAAPGLDPDSNPWPWGRVGGMRL